MKPRLHAIAVPVAAILSLGLMTGCGEKREAKPAADSEKAPAKATAAAELQGSEPASTRPPRAESPNSNKELTQEAIAAMEAAITNATVYRVRVEARRVLFNALRRADRLSDAMLVFDDILMDVEENQGIEMAQRVAFADAGTLHADKYYDAAIAAYQRLIERYEHGPFTAEAMYRMGLCCLEMKDYQTAEALWHTVVEKHAESPYAPWSLRKIALAELIQGRVDDSLATLERLANGYSGTEFEEYAQMRKGYVLMAAGRAQEGRTAYESFLEKYPNSRYVLLAKQQMKQIDNPPQSVSD